MPTVLLVEDQADLREVIRTALGAWGYKVLAAEDGRAGLAIIDNRAEKIDLLLLDVTLPFLSGLELARVSNSQRPTTKCLMMSGYDKQPPAVCDRQSNRRFIRKPFRLQELRTMIEELLTNNEDDSLRQLRGENLHEKATLYISTRLRELDADLHACRAAYLRGELAREEYFGIRRSLRQTIREVSSALTKVGM